jgi:hypothetical protein
MVTKLAAKFQKLLADTLSQSKKGKRARIQAQNGSQSTCDADEFAPIGNPSACVTEAPHFSCDFIQKKLLS